MCKRCGSTHELIEFKWESDGEWRVESLCGVCEREIAEIIEGYIQRIPVAAPAFPG